MFEDIHIGNLALILETCENHLCVIMKYVFWMLKVTFSPWFTCNCWKMSPWIQEEFTLFPRESSRIGHACADYSWDDRLLPRSSWKFPICTLSHWLIYSRKRKIPRTSISSFMFPSKDLLVFHCNKLLLLQIIFWQSQSYLSFQSSTLVVDILRIQQHYLFDICWNFPFGNTKSAVCFPLTRAES
jgi:hypothetical protein